MEGDIVVVGIWGGYLDDLIAFGFESIYLHDCDFCGLPINFG